MHGIQWTAVIIVALVFVSGIIKTIYRHKEKTAVNKLNDISSQKMEEEILSMKDRIAVLEHIVTDNYQNFALNQAIEALD